MRCISKLITLRAAIRTTTNAQYTIQAVRVAGEYWRGKRKRESKWGNCGNSTIFTHQVGDEGGAEEDQVQVQVQSIGKGVFMWVEEVSSGKRG